ncbi:MAG: 4'-phosphopantetheinyl transferase superfamily protein [Gemmatimonadota bacterium]|nr:MAG: 4'-phosphopantetheinyl transferase superfamily protein [Gemmatimonadota bacterium]
MAAPDRNCWTTRSTAPQLTEGMVQVWRVALDAPRSIVEQLKTVLSNRERERTEEIAFERQRLRFIMGRACLRVLLGDYLRQSPRDLDFTYGPHGKPALRSSQAIGSIRFNLAHSHEMALYAFALNREVGVDIEHWHTVDDGPGIARRFFAPEEIKELEALPPDRWQEGFFRCWTRKEAYIKARGEGLTMPLSEFSITVQSRDQAVLLRSVADPNDVSRWSVEDLHPADQFSAALVAEGADWSVELFQLPEWPDRYNDLAPLFRRLK